MITDRVSRTKGVDARINPPRLEPSPKQMVGHADIGEATWSVGKMGWL